MKKHKKIWLEGKDIFCHDFYPLAIDIDDIPTAEILKIARQRLQDIQHPSSNGKRYASEVHDLVHIRTPSFAEIENDILTS